MSRRFLALNEGVLLMILGLWLSACGGDVKRTTGTIHGQADWTGVWPASGSVLVALFKTPPWDANYQPGPPIAFALIPESADTPLTFALDNPPIAFDRYGALVIAWQDPTGDDMAARMFPLSVYGTSLDALDNASAIRLDQDQPDVQVELPALVLYDTLEEMREHYQALR